jgi:hypothetical protein
MSVLHMPSMALYDRHACRVLVAHSMQTPTQRGLSLAVYRDGRVEFRHTTVQPNAVRSVMYAMHHAHALRLASLYGTMPARVIVSRPMLHVRFSGNGEQLGNDHSELLLLTEELMDLGERMMYSCNAAARDYAKVHKFQ